MKTKETGVIVSVFLPFFVMASSPINARQPHFAKPPRSLAPEKKNVWDFRWLNGWDEKPLRFAFLLPPPPTISSLLSSTGKLA